MISLKIIVDVLSYKQLEFESAITKLINSITPNENMLNKGITKDLNKDHVYCYEEEWNSKEKMEEHFQSEKFQTIIGAMKVLGEIIDANVIYADKKENFKQIIN